MRAIRLVTHAAMLMMALVAVGCGVPPRARPVRIESNENVANLFTSWMTWQSIRVAGEPQGLLLRDGDIILGPGMLLYTASDGVVLSVASDSFSTRLSGKIVSVSKSDYAWRWLEGASERELAGLRLVATPESLTESSLAAFKRLAAVNPNVGLSLDPSTALHQVLPLFQPRVLILSDGNADIRRHMANLRKLETLAISGSDSGSLDALPALPRLHRLAIVNWRTDEAGPLPAGIVGLRSLSVLGGDALKDPSALRAAPAGLEELAVLGMENPIDLTPLANLSALRALVLNYSEVSSDLAGLASLKRLQWLGLPKNITQRQFAALVAMHPNLKTLEITEADSVTDLAPLRGLKGLEGLILASPRGNLEALKGLTSLRFLGLGADTTRASHDQLESIRKALPDALVVPVAPIKVCLGSGWILLLIPLAAASRFLGSRPRKHKATGDRSA